MLANQRTVVQQRQATRQVRCQDAAIGARGCLCRLLCPRWCRPLRRPSALRRRGPHTRVTPRTGRLQPMGRLQGASSCVRRVWLSGTAAIAARSPHAHRSMRPRPSRVVSSAQRWPPHASGGCAPTLWCTQTLPCTSLPARRPHQQPPARGARARRAGPASCRPRSGRTRPASSSRTTLAGQTFSQTSSKPTSAAAPAMRRRRRGWAGCRVSAAACSFGRSSGGTT